uniref:Uncharacterized protein n=1 Tax=Triticum urartu TaxID=4572 RepID=A0A8R7TJT6_TRIUA
MSLALRNSWNNPFSWNNELRKKGYESTAYKKRSHDSQYGPSTPINARCSLTDRYSRCEDVIDCEPILGYLHKGMEKIAENQTIIQYLPYVTRI